MRVTITIVSPIASRPMIDAPETICCRLVALTKFEVVDRRHDDDERERQHDPELAEAEHELGDECELGASAPTAAAGAAPRAVVTPRPPRSSPVAARMIASSSASARGRTRARRGPRRARRCGRPCRAPRAARRRSSARRRLRRRGRRAAGAPRPSSPTSMPRVGSSTISSAGLRASHFASTTFCWLPPGERPDRVRQPAVPELQPQRPVGGEAPLGAAAGSGRSAARGRARRARRCARSRSP